MHSDTAIDVNYRLAKSPSFNEMSSCVKSQMKRAVALYFEFIAQSLNAAFDDSEPTDSGLLDQEYRQKKQTAQE